MTQPYIISKVNGGAVGPLKALWPVGPLGPAWPLMHLQPLKAVVTLGAVRAVGALGPARPLMSVQPLQAVGAQWAVGAAWPGQSAGPMKRIYHQGHLQDHKNIYIDGRIGKNEIHILPCALAGRA